ncbi:hypothetical protein GIB67_018451 [Kingdonia uniflora]|uniref:Ssl1-like domain-containing protein n=1 Tax=Kingdonia uniflora TaxID=39325 RepID=A0A7J7LJN7_9MAGN|nr:hypothetical protein GIB67_018451 [Kingdonia uniflora]
MDKLGCVGDASLQNALDLVYENLNDIPSYGHREALILYSALTTCDPADIMETIQKYLLLEHATPPPAIAEFAVSNLIKMRFPQRGAEGVIYICSCHKEVKEVKPVSVLLVRNVSNTFALIVISIFMKACTITRVVRVAVIPRS